MDGCRWWRWPSGCLVSGGAALFLAGTGHFLPHDEHYLGMTARDLCALHGCRVVHFMAHDRAAFGGVLLAIGLVYLWLVEFPLRCGEAWAWWTLLASGALGFASFLAYVGHGYLDLWHGAATLGLLPCYLVGVARTRRLIRPGDWPTVPWRDPGRACLLATSAGDCWGGRGHLGGGRHGGVRAAGHRVPRRDGRRVDGVEPAPGAPDRPRPRRLRRGARQRRHCPRRVLRLRPGEAGRCGRRSPGPGRRASARRWASTSPSATRTPCTSRRRWAGRRCSGWGCVVAPRAGGVGPPCLSHPSDRHGGLTPPARGREAGEFS